jgi:acyl dehydratase
MALDHSLVGVESEPVEKTWDADAVQLYALGLGAGAEDPLQELEFTTENTAGVELKVLPTYAVLAAQARSGRRFGDFDPAKLVHAEQGFELHAPLPVNGRVSITSTITGMYDKGKGALVTTEARAVDAETGKHLITSRSGVFITGEGGFGGDRGPRDEWTVPDGEPDHVVRYRTKPDQALIYRLSGDRNPLHADPAFAARGGFSRPILHGLCTYGFTGRALLHALCGSDPDRFDAMYGRFSRPVLPGDELVISIWRDGGGAESGSALFRTATGDGTVVIDRGRVRFH